MLIKKQETDIMKHLMHIWIITELHIELCINEGFPLPFLFNMNLYI